MRYRRRTRARVAIKAGQIRRCRWQGASRGLQRALHGPTAEGRAFTTSLAHGYAGKPWRLGGREPVGPLMRACLGQLSHSGNPGPFDREGLVLSRPRRHRHADGCERFPAGVAELERRPDRNGQTDTGTEVDLASFSGPLLSPHHTQAAEDVPDLADRPVTLRPRYFASGQLEMGHPPARKTRQDPYPGPVGSDAHVTNGKQLVFEENLVV